MIAYKIRPRGESYWLIVDNLDDVGGILDDYKMATTFEFKQVEMDQEVFLKLSPFSPRRWKKSAKKKAT
jgi:hypothetical protein